MGAPFPPIEYKRFFSLARLLENGEFLPPIFIPKGLGPLLPPPLRPCFPSLLERTASFSITVGKDCLFLGTGAASSSLQFQQRR